LVAEVHKSSIADFQFSQPRRKTKEMRRNMKSRFVTLIIASALTISFAFIRQKAQAQNTSSQITDKTGATIADAFGAKASNSPTPGFGAASQESSPIFLTNMPSGYRDWRLISVAHEGGNLNDIRAILGNDIAIKAYREGKLPFPEGTIIARLAWSYVPSEENNKIFGRPQSFVAGPPTTGSSLWSRTQENTPRRAAGGSLISMTASLPTRQCSKPAFPATRLSNLAILSSPVTHLSSVKQHLQQRKPQTK